MRLEQVNKELTIAKVRLYHIQNGSLIGMDKQLTGIGKSAAYSYFASHPLVAPLGDPDYTEARVVADIEKLEALLGEAGAYSSSELIQMYRDDPKGLAILTGMQPNEAKTFIRNYDFFTDELLISDAEALIEEALLDTDEVLKRYSEEDKEVAKEAIAILRIIDKLMLDKCKEPRDIIAYHKAKNLSYKAQRGL